MRKSLIQRAWLPIAAAAALAGCTPPPGADNATDTVADNLADGNDAAIVDESLAEDVPVVSVPVAAPGASGTESLADAGQIEEAIEAGDDIERVRWGDGWAWTRRGQILRTADRDGRNTAYFRPGEDRPFFVQRGDRSYAYDRDGRPSREYGRDGRERTLDISDRDAAARAERDARHQRDSAEDARRRAGRDDRRPSGSRDTPRPSPTATPSPPPSPVHIPTGRPDRRDRDGRPGRPDPTPSATSSPTPSPTPRWREPQRQPGERDRSRRSQ